MVKSFDDYINEKFDYTKQRKLIVVNDFDIREIIEERIKKFGNRANLNDLDVSGVTSMQGLFSGLMFNGIISDWDVSNVRYMGFMFMNTPFNGDISNWNVENVRTTMGMFDSCTFNQSLNKWKLKNLENCSGMFRNSNFNQDISSWSKYLNKNVKDLDMFLNCPIKEKYKPIYK